MISKEVNDFIEKVGFIVYNDSWWDGGGASYGEVISKDSCKDIIEFALNEFKEKLIEKSNNNTELINLINNLENE